MTAFEEINTDDMYEIELTAPQSAFYLSEAKFPCFCGGFGSGKSFTMALNAVTDLINFVGANIAVYAPTYDLLTLIAMPYIAEILEYGGYEYKINEKKKWFDVVGYGKIIFRSMDKPSSIVGYQVFRSHCDELDTLSMKKASDAWNKIIARNRQKIFKYDDEGLKIPVLHPDGNQKKKKNVLQWVEELNRISAYTTPEGFRFVYERWVKLKKKDDGYELYKVSTYSNPHLPDDYIDTLKSTYPAELVDAYINGEFTNLKSGRVYRQFDRTKNDSYEYVQKDDILHVGMDFNIEHGTAIIHVEREDGDHAVDEIVDSFDTDDTIRILQERYPNHEIWVYPDASGAQRKSSGNNSVDTKGKATGTDLSKLRKAGFKVVVDAKNPLIKERVAAVNARICNGKDTRFYFVNIAKCPNLTNTLEQQVYENGVPDKSTGLDHAGDAMGYYLAKRHPIVKPRAGFIKLKNRGN